MITKVVQGTSFGKILPKLPASPILGGTDFGVTVLSVQTSHCSVIMHYGYVATIIK